MKYIFWIIIVITYSIYPQEKSELQKVLHQSSTLKQLLLSTVPIESRTLSIPHGELDTEEKSFYRIVFSEDNTVIGAVRDKTIYIWQDGTCCNTFNGEHYVRDIKLSQNKQLLATTAGDDIAVWNRSNDTLLPLLKGHQNTVWRLCFSSDSKRLLSVSKEGQVRVWNLDTRVCEHILEGFMYPSKLSFSRLGLYMMCGTQNESCIWDLKGKIADITNQQIEWLNDDTCSRGFFCENNGEQLTLYEREQASSDVRNLRVIKCHDDIATVALCNDGTLLAGGTVQGTLYLFDLKKFNKILHDKLDLDEIKKIQSIIKIEYEQCDNIIKHKIEQFFQNNEAEKKVY